MLKEYQLYQRGQRMKIGTAWTSTVQIENGKTVPNDLLFTRWDGSPLDLNKVTTWFPKFMREHDLPAVTVHSLRHTYASLMIAAHVPIVTVAGRLGHAQTSTNQRMRPLLTRWTLFLTVSSKRPTHNKSGSQKRLPRSSGPFSFVLSLWNVPYFCLIHRCKPNTSANEKQ